MGQCGCNLKPTGASVQAQCSDGSVKDTAGLMRWGCVIYKASTTCRFLLLSSHLHSSHIPHNHYIIHKAVHTASSEMLKALTSSHPSLSLYSLPQCKHIKRRSQWDFTSGLSSEADRKAVTLVGEANTLNFLVFSVGVICSSQLAQRPFQSPPIDLPNNDRHSLRCTASHLVKSISRRIKSQRPCHSHLVKSISRKIKSQRPCHSQLASYSSYIYICV